MLSHYVIRASQLEFKNDAIIVFLDAILYLNAAVRLSLAFYYLEFIFVFNFP